MSANNNIQSILSDSDLDTWLDKAETAVVVLDVELTFEEIAELTESAKGVES